MKHKGFAILAAGALAVGLAGCDVDVEDKGKMPDVDVDVEEGRMPDVDVRGPEVDVETKEVPVTVPDVDVRLPRENDPNVNDRD